MIVGLQIELRVCVDPQYFRGDVYDALMGAVHHRRSVRRQARLARTPRNSPSARRSMPARSSPPPRPSRASRRCTLSAFPRMDASVGRRRRAGLPRRWAGWKFRAATTIPNRLDHGTFDARHGRWQMSGRHATPVPSSSAAAATGVTLRDARARSANRPALSSIAYRVGAYATFNASMLAALSGPDSSRLWRRCAPATQRLHHRAARRLGRHAGHPDLLPGALRQRGVPAHRRRSALGVRACRGWSATSPHPGWPPRPCSPSRFRAHPDRQDRS